MCDYNCLIQLYRGNLCISFEATLSTSIINIIGTYVCDYILLLSNIIGLSVVVAVLVTRYSETSQPAMGPENNVGLGGCWIMECLLP